MNKTLEEAISLVDAVLLNAQNNLSTKIFIPPFPFLTTVASKIQSRNDFFLGAQNCSNQNSGAFTGEVSAAMLASVGCSYVLVGHSERRQYFNETSSILAEKIKQALANNLKPIFCFGETLAERKSNTHFEVVKKQLDEVLDTVNENEFKSFVLAYEPVWAIGTGETASPQQAQEMHAFIRSSISTKYSKTIAENTSILYGGSCNPQNASELFACQDIDGGLIGGASLKADDFCKIIEAV